MNRKTRVLVLAIAVALPAYLAIKTWSPYLPPESLYAVAAGVGFVVGLALDYLWVRLTRK